MEEEETNNGYLNITVTEESVKYDTNLPAPDSVFWLEVVKSMVMNSTLPKSEA